MLRLQPMGAEGTRPLTTWTMHLLGKPKWSGFASIVTINPGCLVQENKAPHKGKGQEEAPSGNSGWSNIHAHKSPFVQGCPPAGNGSRHGGHQCYRALVPLHRSHAPPGRHARHLLSYTGQPICSAKGQGLGHQSGQLLGQVAYYNCSASG